MLPTSATRWRCGAAAQRAVFNRAANGADTEAILDFKIINKVGIMDLFRRRHLETDTDKI